MANKRLEKKKKKKEEKARRKLAMLARHGMKSNYARKAAYLRANGGWGWEYPEPKPWK